MGNRKLFFSLLVLFYIIGVVIVQAVSGDFAIRYFLQIEFWIGLVVAVLIAVALDRWPRQSYSFIMRLVPIIVLAIGFTLIFLSEHVSLWANPPWEPSVFGAGVSVTALGIAFLFAFWPRHITQQTSARVRNPRLRRTGNSKLARIRNSVNEIIGKHTIVMLGLILTFLLLIAFLLIQHFFPSILQLDVKWIVVAVIPLIVSLILGGYIRVIRGFGFELETRIEEPIVTIDLEARMALTSLPPVEKQRFRALERMSQNQKSRITRLRFLSGRRSYYSAMVVDQYMWQLPNLEYFEVLNPNGTFVCLIPIHMFKLNEEIMREEIDNFIIALEENLVLDEYRQDAITLSVRTDQRIIDVLETLRAHGTEIAVVLDAKRSALGIIKTIDIERRIADEVLVIAKRKKK
jgi:hypothetical protein